MVWIYTSGVYTRRMTQFSLETLNIPPIAPGESNDTQRWTDDKTEGFRELLAAVRPSLFGIVPTRIWDSPQRDSDRPIHHRVYDLGDTRVVWWQNDKNELATNPDARAYWEESLSISTLPNSKNPHSLITQR